jgi:taurine dioxygenase
MALEITELSAALGAEVQGVDLRREIAPNAHEALRRAWRERHLLLFRGQDLSAEDQTRAVSCFAPGIDESPDGAGVNYVSNARPDGILRRGVLLFHSDLAFTSHPLQAISLYAQEIPASGSATHYASAVAACRSLPAALRARAAGLRARHVFDLVGQRGDQPYRLEHTPNPVHAEHPVIWPHPETGQEILYVSQMQTDRILGVSERESAALLEQLLAHLYRPEHLYVHHWRPRDLVVWDNWALQHARVPFDEREKRTLRRAVAGVGVVRAYEHVR